MENDRQPIARAYRNLLGKMWKEKPKRMHQRGEETTSIIAVSPQRTNRYHRLSTKNVCKRCTNILIAKRKKKKTETNFR